MMTILFCITSFVLGAAIGLRLSAARSAASPVNSPVAIAPSVVPAEPPAKPPDDGEASDGIDLPHDYPIRAIFNGKLLKLNYDSVQKDEKKELLKEAKVQPLSDGRMLAKLGNTLYMLDAAGQVRWRYQTYQRIIDFVVAESAGLVYGIADDEVYFILESATGKCLQSEGHNGKAFYVQILPYGSDGCLVIDSLAGYRLDAWLTSLSNPELVGKFSEMADGLIAYRGTKRVWTAYFPPDAELIVKGKYLYAVTKTDAGIYVRKMRVSQLKKH